MTLAESTGEVRTVRSLIDHMADVRPDRPFLISPETGRVLSFRDLRAHAQDLGRWLRRKGLERGDKLALLMDNGLFTAQLFLGAMYAGFVVAPLNVRSGASQLAYMLEHCDAPVAVVNHEYGALINEAMEQVSRPIEIIFTDTDIGPDLDLAGLASEPPPPPTAEDPALLMYTSGSTGRPKGAVHTHRSILAHGRNSISAHELTAEDRSLLVLPLYHINAECVTLTPMLLCGGSVVVPRQFVLTEFWNWLEAYQCTWSALVPTIISQLLDWKDPKADGRAAVLKQIRFFRSSSAPLSPSLHREFIDKFGVTLIQAMGSSEAGNVFANPLPPGQNKIGSPGLPWGFELKITDRQGEALAAGEPGEVLIRGDGMMRGYYKDPEETAAALDLEGWLHTGDLAYEDEDGYLFVVGRSKELIIKGGVNIAPKQIDEVLEAHPAVLEAAAVGVADRYVGEDVVAFVVLRAAASCDERELLRFCESRLGSFKTPAHIYFVKELPKGPSGKVQRLRLVDEAGRPVLAGADAAGSKSEGALDGSPESDATLERTITQIWADLLRQPQIDPESNFFALGGRSLLAMQYLSRLREQLPVSLTFSDFFENASVAQQVALVRDRMASAQAETADASRRVDPDLQPIAPRDRVQPCPLSLSQERIWFMEQLNPGTPVYNEAEAVRLIGRLDVAALEAALNAIAGRHEILRTTIEMHEDRPVAIVHEHMPLRLNTIDLRDLPADQREAEMNRLLVDEPSRAYRLEQEAGIRATIIRLSDEENVFIVMMHHMICDRLSVGVLWRELGVFYEGLSSGQGADLEPLPIQYGDYASWQRQPDRRARIEADIAFWKERLEGAPKVLDLPADRSRPAVVSYRGAKRRFAFDRVLASDLRRLCRQEQASLFNVFAAAMSVLMYRYTGQDDVLIGIPIADRDRPELQSMIGFLIDTHVLRTDLSGEPTFRELLGRVQQGVMGVYAHRSAPFDQVVAALRGERSLSHSPVFQVMLNWRDRDAQLQFVGLAGLVVEPLLAECKISKFDLSWFLTDTGDDIQLEMEYSTDLFDEARIERMAGHVKTILESVVVDVEQKISELPILTAAERHKLLDQWNVVEGDAAYS